MQCNSVRVAQGVAEHAMPCWLIPGKLKSKDTSPVAVEGKLYLTQPFDTLHYLSLEDKPSPQFVVMKAELI